MDSGNQIVSTKKSLKLKFRRIACFETKVSPVETKVSSDETFVSLRETVCAKS